MSDAAPSGVSVVGGRSLLAGDFSSTIASKLAPTTASFRLERAPEMHPIPSPLRPPRPPEGTHWDWLGISCRHHPTPTHWGLIALGALAVSVAGYGQALSAAPAPLVQSAPARPIAMQPPGFTVIPLIAWIPHSTDVLRDAVPEASDGLHMTGLTLVNGTTPEACGSGVIISTDGYVITAAHVVDGARRIQVVTAAGPRPALCVAYDKANDLAVLKMAGSGYPALHVRPSETVTSGEPVVMIGIRIDRFWGFAQRVARGVVARYPYDPRWWQANTPGMRGHSGGALLDAQGRLIGVITATSESSDLGQPCEHPTEITTIAVKTAYALPLLPRSVERVPPPPAVADLDAATALAEPAVVTVLTYNVSTAPSGRW